MNAALTIGLFTLKKALRERLFLLTLLMTLVVLGAAGSVSFYQTGVQLKFLKDVAMLSVSGFGFLLVLFVAPDLLPSELEQRGFQFLAARPIRRAEVVAGKFLALVALLAGNLLPLVLEVFGLVRLYSGSFDFGILKGSFLVFLEMAVFGALVLFLSAVLTRVITLFAALFLYVVAHLSDWVVNTFLAASPAWLREGSRLALAVVPDLSHFDSRYVVVHAYDVPAAFMGWLILYAALFIAVFLLATARVLEAREL